MKSDKTDKGIINEEIVMKELGLFGLKREPLFNKIIMSELLNY